MSNGQQQKDNSGALFKNDRKETANHPDYRGSITIDGTDYWLSAWIKVSQKDNKTKFMSLFATPKEQPAAKPVAAAAKTKARAPLDEEPDDLPF
jgi:hypothetical protein